MIAVQKVLFPTDFSRSSNQALFHALFMTKHYHAQLHILHVAVPPGYSPEAASVSQSVRSPEDQVQSTVAAVRSQLQTGQDQCFITGAVSFGTNVPQVILEYASDHDVDLIVMGTHGRQGVEHLLLGSVAETVVRHALCPVVTVRATQPTVAIPPQRILVPIDLSDHSVLALSYGRWLAADFNAQLQVLHVVENDIHPSFYTMGQPPITLMMADILLRARAQTEQLLAQTPGPKVPAETLVVRGYPPAMIIQTAQKLGSDLIVIATHGLTGIEHFLLGSVTEKVVRTAVQPVFTVKSFGKKLLPADAGAGNSTAFDTSL
jgi:nucleotide-binding universal stress UspA family protein